MADETSRSSASENKPAEPAVTRFFVSSSPGGGWLVFREGQQKPVHALPRKMSALETARTMARFNVPSQVIVEMEDGSYQVQYDFPLGAI